MILSLTTLGLMLILITITSNFKTSVQWSCLASILSICPLSAATKIFFPDFFLYFFFSPVFISHTSKAGPHMSGIQP